MINILLVSPNKNSLSDFKTGFEEYDTQITWVESCKDTLAILKNNKFDLIVTDEKLADTNGIKCIKELILFNPMLNCAAVSSLSPDDFHEASEGLGILMQIPQNPGEKDAIKLFDHLKTILNLTEKAK